MRLLPVGDSLVEIHVRESARARRLRIVVPPGAPPEVVVPPGTSERAVAALLAEHEAWLTRQLARRRPAQLTTLPRVTEREGRRCARAAIEAVATDEAERLGVRFERIAIRDQRTRWGSCSSRGTLSFNWRLVLAPADVLDYVVVHELCHLREQNHSPRFWKHVERARPGFRGPRAWLADHGWELLAYRPA